MSDVTLGQIINGFAARDAIHIAIAPMIAAEDLSPGEHVGLVTDDREKAIRAAEPIGIVDPFIKDKVRCGERFYLFLYPNTITALRHEWTHPAFAGTGGPAETSKAWIADFALRHLGISGERMMQAADAMVLCDDYTRDDTETYKGVSFDEFWKHYEIVTGRKPPEYGGAPFTCSC